MKEGGKIRLKENCSIVGSKKFKKGEVGKVLDAVDNTVLLDMSKPTDDVDTNRRVLTYKRKVEKIE